MEKQYVVIISIHADPAMTPGYDEWGGTHTYMKELLDCFGDYHFNVIMFTRKSMDLLPDCEKYNDYATLYRLKNGAEELIDKNLLIQYHEQNKQKIKEILSPIKENIISLHSVYWNSGRVAMEIAKEWNIPFVHSIISNGKGRLLRGATEKSPMRVKYEQEIFIAAKTLLCVSEDEKNDLIELYNINEDKIIVAGQEVAQCFMSPCQDKNGFPRLNSHLTLEDQNKLAQKYNLAFESSGTDSFWANKAFTYLGRVYYNKGVSVIVKAWYELYKEHEELTPPLWIIGGSLKEIEETRTQIKEQFCECLSEIESKHKIIWWGCLDFQSVSTLFLKSLTLIMHSSYEPGGRVIVEAMANGLPVIATPNGFGKDYIQNWKNGFLVPYGNVEELCLRMEHFIRQPYLSSAMGINAQNIAYHIINKWDFFGNHLIAYGLKKQSKSSNKFDFEDCMFKREINIYPFYNQYASIDEISNSLLTQIHEAVITIQPLDENATSHVYSITTSSHQLIAKEVYHRFTLSPMYNPIDNVLIRNKNDFYKIEKQIYQIYYPNYLIVFDDQRKLLFIKKHTKIDKYEISELREMIDFLKKNNPSPRKKSKELYTNIMLSPINQLSDIKNIFLRLNQIDIFYFECTGFFSARFAWKLAPYLIQYNQRYLSKKITETLNKYISFYSKLKKEDFSNLTLINADLAAHHFLKENDKIVPIDFEKLCIGIPEANVACLLYDYTRREYISINEALDEISNEPFQLSLILQMLAYRYFYQIVMQEVMKQDTTLLNKKAQEIYEYSLCSNLN